MRTQEWPKVQASAEEESKEEQKIQEPTELFGGQDPAIILPLLHSIPITECLNGKGFFKTYQRWDSLTTEQRNKVAASFLDEKHFRVHARVIELSTKQGLRRIQLKRKNPIAKQSLRSTTKHV